ncbi:hypothetical protein CHS0354_042434 [Potamilus streckersoni]|uniref:Talin IBS2B domain-containing protein n=1 Tax=Potamilus streckersoni TaxID=2493646 RepID=A0AAE0SUC5_9BIVA|nr:hypothetical protein CHS0354_042434 [Potamilus streckersoni]
MKLTMCSNYARTIACICDHNQVKIHTVAELLLLSGNVTFVRHSTADDTVNHDRSPHDRLLLLVNSVLDHVSHIAKCVNDFKVKWKSVCDSLNLMGDTVTLLVQTCSNYMYNLLSTYDDWDPPKEGLIDKYDAAHAGLEIRLSCMRLKKARYDELSPHFIMELCSNISKYISVLTDICRNASEKADDPAVRDQFKLCIKSVTCAAGCLIASIKSFKMENTLTHHSRVMVFCEPVLASSQALVLFATEDAFCGPPIELSENAKEIQRNIFGPCMNIVSGCVQICKAIREYIHDSTNPSLVHRVHACFDSIQRSVNHLIEEIRLHPVLLSTPDSISSVSPSQRDSSPTEKDLHDVSANNIHTLSVDQERVRNTSSPTSNSGSDVSTFTTLSR